LFGRPFGGILIIGVGGHSGPKRRRRRRRRYHGKK